MSGLEAVLDRLSLRAATIDELLSDDFESLRGEKAASDAAALRLAAWCRSSASGDWELFARRLKRDGLAFDHILSRFSRARRRPAAPKPVWLSDAPWIANAMCRPLAESGGEEAPSNEGPLAFEELLLPVVAGAELDLEGRVPGNHLHFLSDAARRDLRNALLSSLSTLTADAFYEAYQGWSLNGTADRNASLSRSEPEKAYLLEYSGFLDFMRREGIVHLFHHKPVLLRLIASVVRQWIASTGEFVTRLAEDLPDVTRELLRSPDQVTVVSVVTDVSDRHNFGRSVLLLTFSDTSRVVYKPKDMRLDKFCGELVGWANARQAPVDLRVPRVLCRNGYGWSEFISHSECGHSDDLLMFYRRAGAWLAMLHVCAGTDMHQENVIANGSHPVPVDHEMLYQAEKRNGTTAREAVALDQALRRIGDSVVAVGLLPSYTRTVCNEVFALGGLDDPENVGRERYWDHVNSHRMHRKVRKRKPVRSPNVPYINGAAASLGEFRGALISGFTDYGQFLSRNRKQLAETWLVLLGKGLAARSVLRSTQFYHLLITRLTDHRNMHDGVTWSANLDFVARVSDPDDEHDRTWPLLRSERNALADLNVPLFHMPIDGTEVSDHGGIKGEYGGVSGLIRARRRLRRFGQKEIAWQADVIRASTAAAGGAPEREMRPPPLLQQAETASMTACRKDCLEAADEIAHEVTELALRSGQSASWIGLHWLPGTDVSQLKPLGFNLYDGAPGVALFLAAHAHTTGDSKSAELALAGIAALRANIRMPTAARFARSLGLGGCSGIGSVVYVLTIIARLLGRKELIDDALVAASLVTDELIEADQALDVTSGSAGCILALLAFVRETGNDDALRRAVSCGEHLLRVRPVHTERHRMWVGAGLGARALTGMSHGASGFGYAFAALHQAVGRNEFAHAAKDCVDYEQSEFSHERGNWPDLRRRNAGDDAIWLCQWCHGAGGIGLARLGMLKRGYDGSSAATNDLLAAIRCAEQALPHSVDTLCCGSLGNIELLREAGSWLGRKDQVQLASHHFAKVLSNARSSGDYRWGVGERRFCLGMFRGVAGVGYTALRHVNSELPNILLWE